VRTRAHRGGRGPGTLWTPSMHLGISFDNLRRKICGRCEPMQKHFLMWIVSSDLSVRYSRCIGIANRSTSVFRAFGRLPLQNYGVKGAGGFNQREIIPLTTKTRTTLCHIQRALFPARHEMPQRLTATWGNIFFRTHTAAMGCSSCHC
jgi:hypothetical protein